MTASLSGLTVGALALTPAFDADVTEYTATTTNATNNVTATPADSNAAITVTVGGVEIENGTAASWSAGGNTLKIKVTNKAAEKTYTVTVTKA